MFTITFGLFPGSFVTDQAALGNWKIGLSNLKKSSTSMVRRCFPHSIWPLRRPFEQLRGIWGFLITNMVTICRDIRRRFSREKSELTFRCSMICLMNMSMHITFRNQTKDCFSKSEVWQRLSKSERGERVRQGPAGGVGLRVGFGAWRGWARSSWVGLCTWPLVGIAKVASYLSIRIFDKYSNSDIWDCRF